MNRGGIRAFDAVAGLTGVALILTAALLERIVALRPIEMPGQSLADAPTPILTFIGGTLILAAVGHLAWNLLRRHRRSAPTR